MIHPRCRYGHASVFLENSSIGNCRYRSWKLETNPHFPAQNDRLQSKPPVWWRILIRCCRWKSAHHFETEIALDFAAAAGQPCFRSNFLGTVALLHIFGAPMCGCSVYRAKRMKAKLSQQRTRNLTNAWSNGVLRLESSTRAIERQKSSLGTFVSFSNVESSSCKRFVHSMRHCSAVSTFSFPLRLGYFTGSTPRRRENSLSTSENKAFLQSEYSCAICSELCQNFHTRIIQRLPGTSLAIDFKNSSSFTNGRS